MPMDTCNATRIAELLCTRLCHDLTGPIGAVNNGAEFLKEEGGNVQGQAVDLIVTSAEEAVMRLQFYRRAYGRINEDGEASLTDHKQVSADFLRGTKIQLDWPDLHTDASGVSISRKMGRVILNLVIIASHTLIRGGTLTVRVETKPQENDACEKFIRLTAEGQSVKWEKEQEAVLRLQVAEETLTPKTVQLYLTARLMAEIGAQLSWQAAEGRLELTVCQKTAAVADTESNGPPAQIPGSGSF
jgi:histidine phosphotransferase ChpT